MITVLLRTTVHSVQAFVISYCNDHVAEDVIGELATRGVRISVARSVEISLDLAISGACLATNFRVRD